MSQLSINRLGKLLRWTFATDYTYNRKCLGMYVAMISIIMQMNNLNYLMGSNDMIFSYRIIILLMGAAILLAGGSYFFISFGYYKDGWKDGLRDLHLLPASNLEKFLVRYLFSIIIQFAVFAIGCVVADILQYIVALIIGREHLTSEIYSALTSPHFCEIESKMVFVVSMILLWIHTLFLLGANFFRSIKFNFIHTMLFLLLLFIIIIWLLPSGNENKGKTLHLIYNNWGILIAIGLLALSILNYWLSYRLFCNRQLIGRYINKL